MPNPTYSLNGYGEMMLDDVRMAAYERAMRAACRPGSVVMDLGAGTGVFSLFACKLGAARVYAVEPSDAITVARELAAANGCSDRIVFLQRVSTELTLPEPVDVVIADVRGVLPMTGTSLATMIDARRFLAPRGQLIPKADTIRAAVVEHQEQYESVVAPWRKHPFGFDASAAERFVLNGWRKVYAGAAALLTVPADLMRLEYETLTNTSADGSIEQDITRRGTAHGLCLWFDCALDGQHGFSNAPGERRAIYGQGFFPLLEPVAVDAGDRVTLRMRASQVAEDYIWSWETAIADRHGRQKSKTLQSTFHGQPFSANRLAHLHADARPVANDAAAVDRFILSRLTGAHTLGAIATETAAEFPARFADDRAALSHVTAVIARYLD